MSRTRIAAFTIILVLGVLLLAEVLGAGAWAIYEGRFVRPANIQAYLKDVEYAVRGGRGADEEPKAAFRIVHPYIGYEDPERPIEKTEVPFERSHNEVCVLIVGGSVAEQLGDMRERMEAAISAGIGKPVSVYNVAVGGYKQPQQMNVFSYLLSLGHTCDIVVNVDGFNEYDLVFDNAEDGVNPWYPYKRLWSLPVAGLRDIPSQSVAYEILQKQEKQVAVASLLKRTPLGRSYLLTFFWRVWNEGANKDIVALRERISEFGNSEEKLLAADGPAYDSEPNALMRKSSQIWSQSSKLMHDMATANNMLYIHMLQPNQYVPESKRAVNETERRIAMGDERHTEVVPQIYALFQDDGGDLRELGVRFYDMTNVFYEEEGQTYRDVDTHLSPLGNEIFSDAISKILVEQWQSR